MKKLVLFLIILLACSQVYAASLDGFEFAPVNKTLYRETGTVSGETIWTPASGKRINLMGVAFSSSDAMEFVIEEDITIVSSEVVESTAVIPRMACTTSGLTTIGNGIPIWKGALNEKLYLGTFNGGTSINNRHSILLWGFESGR